MSLVLFDLSIVTVKQSFIVGQIVSCSVILSLVLLDSVNNTCYVIHVRVPVVRKRCSAM